MNFFVYPFVHGVPIYISRNTRFSVEHGLINSGTLHSPFSFRLIGAGVHTVGGEGTCHPLTKTEPRLLTLYPGVY